MTNFYTQNADGSIRYYSNDSVLLALQDPDMEQLSTEKNIVYGYDGKLYFEGAKPSKPLEMAHEAKYAEVINQANAAKAVIRSDFSDIEIDTWPVQEAGARVITGTEADVKNDSAALILMSPTAKARTVERVNSLAAIDGVLPEVFAARIIGHAEQAYVVGNLTLDEQRGYETIIKKIMADDDLDDADKVAALESIKMRYTVLESANG